LACAIYETFFIDGSLEKDNILLYHRLQNTCLHIKEHIKQINCNYKKLNAYFNYFHTGTGTMNTVM